ncbi:Solute binding receptor protein [Salmonella enterica subsp. enterica]|uniref:Solute binding receptor protein n=1 Tax=Salmonella enterica I TaxID=59201 RepID=A0A379VZR3_SALET|nr:Solute binding receptor protein [Salmonella enterica subsp. enterica]
MVAGFRQAIKGSAINIVDIAWGDNDIEVQRNLLQENAGTPSGRQCGRRVGDSGGGGDGPKGEI